LTVEHAKKLLADSRTVLDATYDAGLSSPSRLHDLFLAAEAVTPGEYKRMGAGLKITYGFYPSPFGVCLLAITDKGICRLAFVLGRDRERAIQDLKDEWKKATFVEDPGVTGRYFKQIFPPPRQKTARPLPLYLRGTNFQIKVWEALLRIPPGAIVTYEDLAVSVGKPRAARAVGNAVAQNPIAFLIPCHRVIRKIGIIGNYHYGSARKKAMLGWEAARTDPGAESATPPCSRFDTGRSNAPRTLGTRR
jgi:AraC family transcriptional regulator of adaptative response/methylated-DNA-[protein]-cysteine methyltransferase